MLVKHSYALYAPASIMPEMKKEAISGRSARLVSMFLLRKVTHVAVALLLSLAEGFALFAWWCGRRLCCSPSSSSALPLYLAILCQWIRPHNRWCVAKPHKQWL